MELAAYRDYRYILPQASQKTHLHDLSNKVSLCLERDSQEVTIKYV